METLSDIKRELKNLYKSYKKYHHNPDRYEEYQNLIGRISYLEYRMIQLKKADPHNYLRD